MAGENGSVGARIRLRLAELGLHQKDLAARVPISEQRVSDWVRDEARVPLKHRRAIAKALKTDIASLFGEGYQSERSIYQELLDEVRAQRADQRETAAAVATIGAMISDRYPNAKSAPFAQWQTVMAMRALREALSELPPPEEQADAR